MKELHFELWRQRRQQLLREALKAVSSGSFVRRSGGCRHGQMADPAGTQTGSPARSSRPCGSRERKLAAALSEP